VIVLAVTSSRSAKRSTSAADTRAGGNQELSAPDRGQHCIAALVERWSQVVTEPMLPRGDLGVGSPRDERDADGRHQWNAMADGCRWAENRLTGRGEYDEVTMDIGAGDALEPRLRRHGFHVPASCIDASQKVREVAAHRSHRERSEPAVPAAVEQQRELFGTKIEVAHTADDDVVVVGVLHELDGTVDPGDRAVEDGCPRLGTTPLELRELIYALIANSRQTSSWSAPRTWRSGDRESRASGAPGRAAFPPA
jgi:hypothetical protein